VLWILGDLVGLPFLAAQLIHMMREDESDAARIDAELDARQAQVDAGRGARQAQLEVTGEPVGSAAPGEPLDDQKPQDPHLWWENDPRFTSRFKPTS
jgi:hypothetical protein